MKSSPVGTSIFLCASQIFLFAGLGEPTLHFPTYTSCISILYFPTISVLLLKLYTLVIVSLTFYQRCILAQKYAPLIDCEFLSQTAKRAYLSVIYLSGITIVLKFNKRAAEFPSHLSKPDLQEYSRHFLLYSFFTDLAYVFRGSPLFIVSVVFG